ncbi:MAG: hypothetical protein QOK11_3994 [Pseudonocardiales bacterium]|nr:hypothetical protein [Pseudonocardiales bacterium]
MAQIAYVDAARTTAHLVVGFPNSRTLCGVGILGYDDNLPVNRKRWPELSWCEACVAAYGD